MLTSALVLSGGCSPSPPEPPPEVVVSAPEPVPAVSPPLTGTHLRNIRATSGTDVTAVVDGDLATGWRTEGDPLDEAITLRFERPVRVTRLEVAACSGATKTWWNVIVNGAEAGRVDTSPGFPGVLNLGPGGDAAMLSSIELQVADGASGTCVAEVSLADGDVPIALRPPRSIEGTLRTTSVRIPTAAHHPWYLVDGRPDFAWTEGKGAGGVGETVTIALRAPITLVAVELWNGDQRSPETYGTSARATRIGLSVDRGAIVSLPVRDVMGPQRLPLPRVAVGKLFAVSVLDTVRRGQEGDLSLSEVRLWDPMGPLAVRTPDPVDRRETLMAQLQTGGLKSVLDRRYEHVCAGPGQRRLKLRSNLSFSWTGPGAPGEARESFAGDWALQKAGKVWTSIRLAGRRRPVVMSWVGPEVDREDLGVVQTAEVARVQDLDGAAFTEWQRTWSRGPLRPVVECVGRLAHQEGQDAFDWLVRREAVILRGQAFDDLLWPSG